MLHAIANVFAEAETTHQYFEIDAAQSAVEGRSGLSRTRAIEKDIRRSYRKLDRETREVGNVNISPGG